MLVLACWAAVVCGNPDAAHAKVRIAPKARVLRQLNAESQSVWSILMSAGHVALPGQFSFDFQLQRQTQECADEHDHSQHDYILQGRRNNHSPNQVASNEKFQTEQNRPPYILPIKRIIIVRPMGAILRRKTSRIVAATMPAATMKTPTPSTLVPTTSMICRKYSMAGFITGKRADFQSCFWGTRVPTATVPSLRSGPRPRHAQLTIGPCRRVRRV